MRIKSPKNIKPIRTGPPAGPETILARLSPEERSWFLDLIERLLAVETGLEDTGLNPEMVRQVRMVREFLDNLLLGYPKPGCAHRETPIPELRKGGKK
jgi:hypothetical protein